MKVILSESKLNSIIRESVQSVLDEMCVSDNITPADLRFSNPVTLNFGTKYQDIYYGSYLVGSTKQSTMNPIMPSKTIYVTADVDKITLSRFARTKKFDNFKDFFQYLRNNLRQIISTYGSVDFHN